MIRVSEQATRQAFQAFRARREKWLEGLRLQMEMYGAAGRAFRETFRLDDFQVVYKGLRKWQVFRARRVEDAETVFAWLSSCDRNLGQGRLSSLGSGDWVMVRDAVWRMRNVKPNKTGPSIMAISKFLHFWNPRLFVICDQGEIEGFVLGHRWLWRELEKMGWVLEAAGADAKRDKRLCKYLRVLALASEFLKANPGVLSAFAETVRMINEEIGIRPERVPANINTYEATAAEWCLIGLAEMAPSGVEIT